MRSMNMGGSVVSNNILTGKGRLVWCIREKSVNPVDNGWRFFSDVDTPEFLASAKNMTICDWGTVFEIEPAISLIFDCPVGTELKLENIDGQFRFINAETGQQVF